MPDKDLSNSQDVRRMSPAEVRKLNKDQLVFALRTLIDEPASETEAGPQTVQIARIKTKLDNMLSRWGKERDALQAEIKGLRRDNEKMAETITHHQRMLEVLESDKRASNLIITSLPEESMDGAVTDNDKVKRVMSASELEDVGVKSAERLGARRPSRDTTSGRPHQRPVKVVLTNSSDRQRVLEKAKKLKHAGTAMQRVM